MFVTAASSRARARYGHVTPQGKGLGKVRLQMTYWPFEKFTKYDTENAMTVRPWNSRCAGLRGSPPSCERWQTV